MVTRLDHLEGLRHVVRSLPGQSELGCAARGSVTHVAHYVWIREVPG